jgi:hypothetical protein
MPTYTSSGMGDDWSGYKRNVAYSSGSSYGPAQYGNAGPASALPALPQIGQAAPPTTGNFGVAGMPMTYNNSFGPFNVHSGMDWQMGGQLVAEEGMKERQIAMQQAQAERDRERNREIMLELEAVRQNNGLQASRYADYRRYGR